MPNRIIYNEQATQLKTQIYGQDGVTPAEIFADGAVSVSGSVALPEGTTVSITGTPLPVSIQGTPTVNVGNVVTVSITGTPLPVSIQGTPTVNVGNVVTVSITGTPLPVSIQGTPTVNVGNVVTVSITGTPLPVTFQGTPTVNVGNVVTVSITGTPLPVSIQGTPTVNVGNVVTVSITGTPLPVTFQGTPTVNVGFVPPITISKGITTESMTFSLLTGVTTIYTNIYDVSKLCKYSYFVLTPGFDTDNEDNLNGTLQLAPIPVSAAFAPLTTISLTNPNTIICNEDNCCCFGYYSRLQLSMEFDTPATVTVYFQGQS